MQGVGFRVQIPLREIKFTLFILLLNTVAFSWKEAKKVLKKDSRWESLDLEKSEREKLFDDHMDR